MWLRCEDMASKSASSIATLLAHNDFYIPFVARNRAGCPTMRSALQKTGFLYYVRSQ
jgi:hypothetical protein